MSEMKHTNTVEELAVLLDSADDEVIQTIVKILGELRDPAAVPALIALASRPRSESAGYIRETYALLGVIGDHRAVDLLIERLDSFHGEVVAYALGNLGDKRAAEPLIARLNRRKNPSECIWTLWALGKLADTTAIDPLVRLLGSIDFRNLDYYAEDAAKNAVEAINLIIARCAEAAPENILRLVAVLRDIVYEQSHWSDDRPETNTYVLNLASARRCAHAELTRRDLVLQALSTTPRPPLPKAGLGWSTTPTSQFAAAQDGELEEVNKRLYDNVDLLPKRHPPPVSPLCTGRQ